MKKLLDWLKGLFRQRESEPVSNVVGISLARQRRETRELAKENGAFVSFDDYLEQLDYKFDRLRATKFPEYRGVAMGHAQLLKEKGAFVQSRDALHAVADIDPYVFSERPESVIFSFPNSDERRVDESILGDWVYMIERPRVLPGVEIARRNEKVYSLDILTSTIGRFPSALLCGGFFALSSVGIRELRYKDDNGLWRKSPIYNDRDDSDIPGLTRVESLGIAALNVAAQRGRHWAVTAIDESGLKVVASIPDNDAPRFFRKAQRLGSKTFHSVAAHTRSNGSNVKTHYRGTKEFAHGDYRIFIRPPRQSSAEQRCGTHTVQTTGDHLPTSVQGGSSD